MPTVFYVPKTANPSAAGHYNPQVYVDSTSKGAGWLTPQEFLERFPVMEPVVPPPSPDEMKKQALSALREKRKSVEYGGFEFQGQLWDSSEKDELRLNSMLKMFELTGMAEFPGWKIAEGVYITATPEIIRGAALALMQHYARAFAVETAKAARIGTLASVEAVQAWLETELNQGW